MVVIDCPPQLGFLTTSALSAAAGVLVTIHPEMLDVMSMSQFLRMTADLMDVIAESGADMSHDWMRYLLTRYEPTDYADLQAAIEENGQTVPILVRRNPAEEGRYLLVYGKRRLEAIRNSDRVAKVRALVASMDDTTAQTAQISENMARRDLSFIERALFAKDLVDNGYGSQARVAEALTVTRSSISMAITVAGTVGRRSEVWGRGRAAQKSFIKTKAVIGWIGCDRRTASQSEPFDRRCPRARQGVAWAAGIRRR